MLLALILLHTTALALANPFHKYPYVFLLDVGNEELEKVNTEQIRISKAGGSLALRYPAIGSGEDIAHVRVSGIDFGTDLKANIVDGGPGYKYVILVLMGNPGVAFDAVITIQTVPNQNNDESNLQTIDNDSTNTDQRNAEENDPNDSAEDLSDSAESEEASQVSVSKVNAELTQESSNVYRYAVNEALSGYGSDVHPSGDDQDENNENYSNDTEDNNEENDIHGPFREKQLQVDESNSKLDDYSNDADSSSSIEDQSQNVHDDDYISVIDDQNYASDDGNQEQVNTNLYKEYQAFRQSLYDEEMYPQRVIPKESGTVYVEEPGDDEGPLEEMFSDEYDEDSGKYSDTNNNNFIDRSDGSAIAY